MIDFLKTVLPYISGLYTLPWILVGFIGTVFFSKCFGAERVDKAMKKIALILLYFFVAPLVFRIFLDTPLGRQEALFVLIVILSISFMYFLAYLFALYQIKRQALTGTKRSLYLKTVITNQGRSSAFVGGILLVVESWAVPAGIFMALMGIALFAVIPYLLHLFNLRESRTSDDSGLSLPWFLRIYPYYFIFFVVAAILLQKLTGLCTKQLGDGGVLIRFYVALTIPAALYYVGSGIHPSDMKRSELRKLIGLQEDAGIEHWQWVRQIFALTAVITPLFFFVIFGILYTSKLIPAAWFAVALINSILPITSTNMFLVPYGIDKRGTAHAVTWSTLICVPVVVLLIWGLSTWFA
ncbi:MAG: hypothetical protein U1C33_07100 [Candidatus Cloacimonadaceae bacterium]|nr:hypothetical protein [Candidatus Cloacimonadaceae bacterium]